MGTLAYMAPEQAAGAIDKIDARSDVFGLGAVLCCLLTGEPPFGGKDPSAIRLNAIRGKTEEEVLKNAMEHAKQHGIREVTPDLMAKVKGAIRDEK